MAKTSAKSKGYRKTIKKKPFLTKKEIIELVVIVAILLVGVLLFNLLYDDGYTKNVKAGEVVSYASSELRDRYKKLADIGSIEGFTLEERDENASPISVYNFLPDDESNPVSSITVSGSYLNADSLTAATMSFVQDEIDLVSEVQNTTLQDHDAQIFSYSYSQYVAEEGEEAAEAAETEAETEAEQEPNRFYQNISTYITADDGHTLCLHIYLQGEDDGFYVADDELVDYVKGFESAFTLVQDK